MWLILTSYSRVLIDEFNQNNSDSFDSLLVTHDILHATVNRKKNDPLLSLLLHVFYLLPCSKSQRSVSSAKSAVSQKNFQEWLEDKKQSQKQKAKQGNIMKQIAEEHEKRSKGRSFEDWQRAKQQQKLGHSPQEKRRDMDIIREEPGRYYGLSFGQWLKANNSSGEEIYNRDIF